MKLRIGLLVALAILLSPALVLAGVGHTDTFGCGGCHAAHSSNQEMDASDAVPLWAGDDPNYQAGTFTMYFDDANHTRTHGAEDEYPTGSSRLCMSCHDGGSYGQTWGVEAGDPENIGTDMTDDHPISIIYDGSVAGYNLETSVGELPTGLLEGSTPGSRKIQCASCHDIHATTTYDSALRMDNTNGALCKVCHDK